MTFLLLTVRFLDERYHGLLDRGGPPEWPPSPFRLFSALVAGVARRGELEADSGRALAWLQTLKPPIIIAPKSRTGQAVMRYVPNNDGDRKPDRQERLAAKPTIPTLMLLEAREKPEVHYVWDIGGRTDPPFHGIRDAAHSLTALGWGVDMAFADAMPITEPETRKLPGVRWYPKPGVWRDEGMLRVPAAAADLHECTLCDLKHCHETTIARIEHGEPLHTVDKPRVFERVLYTSVERPIGRPYAVFNLEWDSHRPFRYPQRKLVHIAGMVRHLAKELMKYSPPKGVEEDWVRVFVAGHAREGKDTPKHRQFSYLPLPSIRSVREIPTDPSVRRVMIVAPIGDDAWLQHLARRLSGQRLRPERGDEFGEEGPPTLVRLYYDRKVVPHYTNAANAWASVTPVILPGHDDHKPNKTRKLIERALAQSGIEQPCEFEWSALSRFPKSLSAHKYDKHKRPSGYIRPDHLQSLTAVHLRLRFDHDVNVPGPLAIGAGRHCGLGILAPCQ
jgi:CRISPR-associated protein Csb2